MVLQHHAFVLQNGDSSLLQPPAQDGIVRIIHLVVAPDKVSRGKTDGQRRRSQSLGKVPVLPVHQVAGHHDQMGLELFQCLLQFLIQLCTVQVRDLDDPVPVQSFHPLGQRNFILADPKRALQCPDTGSQKSCPSQGRCTKESFFVASLHFTSCSACTNRPSLSSSVTRTGPCSIFT